MNEISVPISTSLMCFFAPTDGVPGGTSSVMAAISASKCISRVSSPAKFCFVSPLVCQIFYNKGEAPQESYRAFSLRETGLNASCGSGKHSLRPFDKSEAVLRRTSILQTSQQQLLGPNKETHNDFVIQAQHFHRFRMAIWSLWVLSLIPS